MVIVANSFAMKVYFRFEKENLKSVFKLSGFAYYCILRFNEHDKIVNLVQKCSFPLHRHFAKI